MNMRKGRVITALVLALTLLCAAAYGEAWHAAEENLPRFRTLLDLLGELTEPDSAAMTGVEETLEQIRWTNADDYTVASAITSHWYWTVTDKSYRMYTWKGEQKADVLLDVDPEFGKHHAFVVLGYELQGGEMRDELKGRCEAAAAAARAFPDTILLCTGGATGSDNPYGHTEAGEMKKYLTGTCGIDAERIFTETDAMSTADNAVYSMRILTEQGIDTMTIVTSDYHQIWGQILFNAAAAMEAAQAGRMIRIVGNYSYPANHGTVRGTRSALGQLSFMLGIGGFDRRPAQMAAPQ